MPTINKNAFKGYGYQWTVAKLFCYFLEFYKETFISLEAESGNNEHNFDDFSMTTIDGIIHVQTKNYVNEFDEMPIVDNGAVSYCGSLSKLSKPELIFLFVNQVFLLLHRLITIFMESLVFFIRLIIFM